MQELIIGTKNSAKLAQVQGALSFLKLKITGLSKGAPAVEESGRTALENARKKALEYSKWLGKTVLSIDNALYFDGLSSRLQPGINVRRFNGRLDRPTDQEMLAYYQKLISGYKLESGRWDYAICLAWPDGKTKQTTISAPRKFTSIVCEKINSGYPLESLSIDSVSGKYIAQMPRAERDRFWQRTIGQPLVKFVSQALE